MVKVTTIRNRMMPRKMAVLVSITRVVDVVISERGGYRHLMVHNNGQPPAGTCWIMANDLAACRISHEYMNDTCGALFAYSTTRN